MEGDMAQGPYEFGWVRNLKERALGMRPLNSKLPRLMRFGVRSEKVDDGRRAQQVRYEFTVSAFREIPADAPHHEQDAVRLSAIRAIARAIYKEPLDELYQLREDMWEHVSLRDDAMMQRVNRLIAAMEGRSCP